MKTKLAKTLVSVLMVILSVFSFTGCWWFFENQSVDLTLVQEPVISSMYDEEYKYYDVYVEGIVENTADKDVSGSISILIYDADGNVIGSGYDSVELIEVGGKWRFCARTTTNYEPVSCRVHELVGYEIW